MNPEIVTETGATLTHLLFSRNDEELRRRYLDEWSTLARGDALREATGIQDQAVIDRLLSLGVTADTAAAMVLYPLVAMAWADGRMAREEKETILRAAAEAGVTSRSTSRELLDCWLGERPSRDMLDAWVAFARALRANMDGEQFESLAETTLRRTLAVAEAAGGFLGMNRISAKEKAKLDELRAALNRDE